MEFTTTKCHLCLKKADIRESHVIPKFITEWLKKTSATGYIRMAVNPNKRTQDPYKKKLLCNDCEQKLSIWEKCFAENIFYPYIREKVNRFDYKEELRKFIVSVSWRIAVLNIMNNTSPLWAREGLNKYAEDCRKYILSINNDSPYEHHLLFLGEISKWPIGMKAPDRFHHYLLRSVDSTIVHSLPRLFNVGRLFVYIKLPFFVFASFVHPKENSQWQGTIIKDRGCINASAQNIRDFRFGDFLINRTNDAFKLYDLISKKQNEHVVKTGMANPNKILNSKTYEAFLADQRIAN